MVYVDQPNATHFGCRYTTRAPPNISRNVIWKNKQQQLKLLLGNFLRRQYDAVFPCLFNLMKDIFAKTFGGLTKQYLARQLFFGIAMAALFISLMQTRPSGFGIGGMLICVVNAALYPYSRFVYESVVNFIVGDNFFVLPAIPMLMAKCFTMLMCFFLALFIAPIGLAYLYFRHGRV